MVSKHVFIEFNWYQYSETEELMHAIKIKVIAANCTQGILLILNVVGEFRAEAGLLQVVTIWVLPGD